MRLDFAKVCNQVFQNLPPSLKSVGQDLSGTAGSWNGTVKDALRLIGVRRGVERETPDAASLHAAAASRPAQAEGTAGIPLLQGVAPGRQCNLMLVIARVEAAHRGGALHFGVVAVNDGATSLASVPFLSKATDKGSLEMLRLGLGRGNVSITGLRLVMMLLTAGAVGVDVVVLVVVVLLGL